MSNGDGSLSRIWTAEMTFLRMIAVVRMEGQRNSRVYKMTDMEKADVRSELWSRMDSDYFRMVYIDISRECVMPDC